MRGHSSVPLRANLKKTYGFLKVCLEGSRFVTPQGRPEENLRFSSENRRKPKVFFRFALRGHGSLPLRANLEKTLGFLKKT